MKKALKFIKNFILIVFLIAYFSVVIGVSTLLIARNDFNYTQFGETTIVVIDKDSATEKYKENTIVLLKNKKIQDIKEGQEIFVYSVDSNTNKVTIVIETVGKVEYDSTSSPYIVLNNLGTYYGQSYICGVAYKTFEDYGKYLSFLEGKWIFFGLLIVPCFFILIYEIYLLIIAIKYDSVPVTNTNVQQQTPVNNAPYGQQVINPGGIVNNAPYGQQVINPGGIVNNATGGTPMANATVQPQAPVVDVPLENLNVASTPVIPNTTASTTVNNASTVTNLNANNAVQPPTSNVTQAIPVPDINNIVEINDDTSDDKKKPEELINEVQN